MDIDEIRTERLRLRRARADDLSALHDILSRPEATRYTRLPHERLEESKAWLDSMIASGDEGGDDFVIEHQGRVIGKAGFYRPPEIGYLLHPDFWGQGLASEAVGAVIARAFDRNGLPEITADVDPRNTASIAILERFGFQEVGRAPHSFQRGEEWCDSVYFVLRRPSGAGSHGTVPDRPRPR